MKEGATGEVVKIIQKIVGVTVDGIWGPRTTHYVKSWQMLNNLTPDGIIGLNSWRVLLKIYLIPSSRKINELIIHCTATKAGKQYTIEDIKKDHQSRGFVTIGYHYVIYEDGSIHEGRDVRSVGAHCSNHNLNSIGIAYIGGLNKNGKAKDTRTPEQKESLLLLLTALKELYPNAVILGHRDTSPDLNNNGIIEQAEWIKECPCFNAKEEYK